MKTLLPPGVFWIFLVVFLEARKNPGTVAVENWLTESYRIV
jgi:hypothetical protein